MARCFPGIMVVVVVGLFVSACTPGVVSEEKIKADLSGQQFPFQQTFLGQQAWKIEPDEIKGFRLLRRATDKKAGTDAVYVAIRLEGGTQVISGDLKITYRLYDQGWQLDSVQPHSEFLVSKPGSR